ncbi:hypothetical protein EW146_g963 [Bondarzewia mesenterica]|uniref:N-acetyltransferase ECO1 n=1 Tax=Bondarzewia mesenterica TaxID=1095465 RepID=A0A4S4MBI0_9AGAM|nr:hypothetical protein EW146_g963 [Bondarzewia mesenterica]
MSGTVKRTYGSRSSRPLLHSSSSLDLSSSHVTPSLKRPLSEHLSFTNTLPPKRPRLVPPSSSKDTKSKMKSKPRKQPSQKSFTQLHFSLDTSILRTCSLCDLTYTKGAPDDESLHKAHCARVQRGMEWGKEEDKECVKAGVQESASAVRLKNGKKGRIICFRADVGKRIGSKLSVLLETIGLTLSSPPLTSEVLLASKVYLFLLPSITTSSREKIVGCVIAQRISTAMAIVSPSELAASSSNVPPPTATLVPVDTSTGLFCHPTPLPTPLGIPRLFVPSAHRRQGVASHLLNVVADTFIHGCKLDPRRGDVAFTQPTGLGRAVMDSWGGKNMRIYQE